MNAVNVFGPATDADIRVKEFGYALADAVKAELPKEVNPVPSLEIVSKIIYLPIQDYTEEELEWSREAKDEIYNERSFLSHRRRLKISIWGVQQPLEKIRKYDAIAPAVSGDSWRIPVEIHVFKLDQETAIVTMPCDLLLNLE